MARVLPKRYKPPTRQRPRKRPGLTDMEKATQGVRLAGSIANLAGGIGQLVYPGGIPEAISDAVSGGPSEEDRQQAAASAYRTAARSAAASGGMTPSGQVVPAMRVQTGEEMPEQVQSRGPLGRAFGVETPPTWAPGIEAPPPGDADRLEWDATQQAAQPPAPAEQMVEVVVPAMRGGGRAQMYRDMAAQNPGLTPESVQSQIEEMGVLRKGGGPGLQANAAIQLKAGAQAAPVTESPEPTPEQPAVVSKDRFVEAAKAARSAGRFEEFRRWSEMAITNGALQGEGLTRSEKVYLERVLSAQAARMGEDKARSSTVREIPERFEDVYGRLVTSESPEEVRALLQYASAIQPARGIRASRAGIKDPEMERIEKMAAWKLGQFDEAEFPAIDEKSLADLRYRDARTDLYTGQDTPSGPRTPRQDTFSVTGLKKQLNQIVGAVTKIGSPAHKANARLAQASEALETAKIPLSDSVLEMLENTDPRTIVQQALGAEKQIESFFSPESESSKAIQKALESSSEVVLPRKDFGLGLVFERQMYGLDQDSKRRHANQKTRLKEAAKRLDARSLASSLKAYAKAKSKHDAARDAAASAYSTGLPKELKDRIDALAKRFAAWEKLPRRRRVANSDQYDQLVLELQQLRDDASPWVSARAGQTVDSDKLERGYDY